MKRNPPSIRQVFGDYENLSFSHSVQFNFEDKGYEEESRDRRSAKFELKNCRDCNVDGNLEPLKARY